jgi:hypothetical protein
MFRRIGRLTVLGVMAALVLACVASVALQAEEKTVAQAPAPMVQAPIPIPANQRSFPQFVTTRVDDAVFAVGFQIAQLRVGEGSDILPLVVGMQNFKHKMWSVKLKDFQLYDETGTLIEPLSLKEIRQDYKRYAKDYQFIEQTTTLNQMLPNAEFAGGVRGGKQIQTIETGTTFYQYTLFYPTPGDTAVYSATLDFKNFFFDLIYYRDIADKWLRMSVPGKKRRPQMDLVFKFSANDE